MIWRSLKWKPRMSHFRVPLCLCAKASLSAKPFLWKWLWFAWEWNCSRIHFHMKGFALRLVLKQTHKRTRKWLAYCNRGQLFRPCWVSSARCSKQWSNQLIEWSSIPTKCRWFLPQMKLKSRVYSDKLMQGWIQTSATSFQKLVRIVKKLKKKTRKPCQKVQTARCQFLPGVQLQNLLIPTALHLLPACSGPAPWVSLNLVLTLPPPPP